MKKRELDSEFKFSGQEVEKKSRVLAQLLAVATAISTLSGLCEAEARVANSDRSSQALQLFESGKIPEALNLQAKEIKANQNDWRAHETMAYLRYRSGDLIQSIVEGRQAAELAPDNETVLLNLGYVALGTGDYEDAISAFSRAKTISPSDPSPWIGLTHTFIRKRDEAAAKKTLTEMVNATDKSFDWCYQTAQALLLVQDFDAAISAADKAFQLTQNAEEKSAAEKLVLLANLRAKNIIESMKLATSAFANLNLSGPEGVEIYTLKANELASTSEPDAMAPLIASANRCLISKEDSDAFFRLGRIFAKKAREGGDGTNSSAWWKLAKESFESAIRLDKEDQLFHLALAGVNLQLGNEREFSGELKSCSDSAWLTKFLTKSGVAKTVTAEQAVNLTRADFNVDGLSCSCKIPVVLAALEKIPGVAFVSLSSAKPYNGTVFIDEKVTPVADAFSYCEKNAFEPGSTGITPPPTISLKEHARQQDQSITSTILSILDLKSGAADHFTLDFADPQPSPPVSIESSSKKI